MAKLDIQHKHVMQLIARDAGPNGWAAVSNALYPILSKNIPTELMEFEPLVHGGGRARLTSNGHKVVYAMQWL